MFEKTIISSMRYQNPIEEILNDKSEKDCLIDNKYQTGDDFIRHIEEESEWVLIPERLKRKDLFIHLAKTLSKTYEIDTDIYQNSGGITANIYIEPSLVSGQLKNLFSHLVELADELSFFIPKDKEHSLLVSLDYFTHELYLSGRKVRNIE